jgi:hypothetical protein
MYQPVTQFEARRMGLDTWDQATLAPIRSDPVKD